MIYLKRLWNVIATTLAIIVGICLMPLILLEITIVELVYYVATGESFVDNHYPLFLKVAISVYKHRRFNDV